MSNLKRKHQDINKAPSSDIPNTTPSAHFFDAGFFPLPETRFPLGTPIHSERSRKFYSDLADEREFLLYLKELWKSKLDRLKEDKKLLERMKNVRKSDVVDVEPLFCSGEILQAAKDNVLEEHGSPLIDDMEKLQEENEHDPFKIVNGQVVVKDSNMLATLQELDRIYMDNRNIQQQESSEEEAEEDDEEARKALHRMLEEFGGSF